MARIVSRDIKLSKTPIIFQFPDGRFLAPAVLAQPGALEVVSVSESVSECVPNFLLSKRPSL